MISFSSRVYQEMSPWEVWISRSFDDSIDGMTRYDHLCEMAVSSYELARRTREEVQKDKVHFFLDWWNENKKFMLKYKSSLAMGRLLGVNHATVLHYCGTKNKPGKRKKTAGFKQNVECIKDFLES